MLKFKILLPLFIIQFFTWLGLFALWIYATPAIAKQYFRGTSEIENSANWVGYCFAFYSLSGASLTFLLNKMLKIYPKLLVHGLCLLIGAIGLLSIYFFSSKSLLLISFLLIGISWASISTTPYNLVGNLAADDDNEAFYSVFNFSTVIPQVVASVLLAFLTKNYFAGDLMKTIFTGGIFLFTASMFSFIFYLKDNKN